MNKIENSSSSNQSQRPHQEGQMNNTPPGSRNNSQVMRDINPGNKKSVNQTGAGASETESDRANRNEDEGVRGGNSSI
ncbi:hypothetical protein EPD60_14125 [Flaviaesturariibacter flavus]|uniref:Uncharacterized protein n=1 Tax=Flaviaesturariibacter flavus TaxID=2502780 RepID=A0A4R1B4L5_9BACT|nr:hypothetical protein [Flaviaesturariibacter flavus]TCJ12410.1 hypothetical protein EPD60_14125 [Flaviaesturariibacter flavus]